jgi:hypothetical protein
MAPMEVATCVHPPRATDVCGIAQVGSPLPLWVLLVLWLGVPL